MSVTVNLSKPLQGTFTLVVLSVSLGLHNSVNVGRLGSEQESKGIVGSVSLGSVDITNNGWTMLPFLDGELKQVCVPTLCSRPKLTLPDCLFAVFLFHSQLHLLLVSQLLRSRPVLGHVNSPHAHFLSSRIYPSLSAAAHVCRLTHQPDGRTARTAAVTLLHSLGLRCSSPLRRKTSQALSCWTLAATTAACAGTSI